MYVGEVTPVIFVKVMLSAEDCHWMVPVDPLNVSTELLAPEQTVVLPEIVPTTVAGLTVIVAVEL